MALAAAITVIIASALGLPVSSTHIAVGGVFGVGFLREYLAKRASEKLGEKSAARPSPMAAAESGIEAGAKTVADITPELAHELDGLDKKSLKKKIKKSKKRKLVRRNHAWTIAAAWIITVPIAALLAAALFHLLMGLGLSA